MRIGFWGKRFGPWLLLAMIIGLAAAIRWRINFGGALIPGVNGPYYPVQVRSLLEDGRLAFPDFPLVFWLEALVARLLFALKVGSLSDCIMWASKGVDALFPTLVAVPAYLLARAWIAKGTRRSWLALVVAAFSVLFPFALVMTADFQKNAVGVVWLFFFIYCLYQALRQGSRRTYLIAGVFFVLTALTHIGCFGIAIVFLLIVAITSLLLEPARRRIILRGVGFLFLLLASATAVLYFFFDPARVERLLKVFLLPAELFEKPVIFGLLRGQASPDFIFLIVVHALALVGLVLLVRRWKVVEPFRRLIVLAAVPLTFLLASPLFGQEWAMRLSMIAYIPTTVVLAFLFAHLQSRTALGAVTAVTLIPIALSAVMMFGGRGLHPAGISEASYEELQQLRSLIAQPEETLVLARHGLEWWAAWVLETDVGQRSDLGPEVWNEYAEILYLEQIAGTAGFGPGGPVGPPFPEVKFPPEAEILFEGQYFRLARAVHLDRMQREKTHLSKVAGTPGAYWVRGFDLFWNEIEPTKGKFNWSFADEKMREFNQLQIYPLVIVKPFANWDQDRCHPEEKYKAEFDPMKGGGVKVGAPCDLAAYAQFLEKAVERYDGDGEEDMPGLTIPIKYWEIMNEPEMQGGATGGMGEELKFFVGTPQEYLEILKTSYQTIKRVDPQATVAHAGMAGVQENFRDFWTPVFANGGGDYTDIANIHTISTDEKREDLYVIRFKRFLEQFGIKNKPIWITEVQYGSLTEKPKDLQSFEILMAKSSVFSLALGADKLFYIENWLHWNGGWEKERKEELETSTHQVYLNLVNKINHFERIEALKEEYEENPGDWNGATSKIGQYKFISGEKVVYALWGKAKLPAEITGKIKVTDIYGESKAIQAKDLVLSAEPIFIELSAPCPTCGD